jgi:hypothetical protein
MRSGAERRVVGELPEGTLEALVDGLSPTDLRTLLLAVTRDRAAKLKPAQVLRQWREDRFVRPAATDPRALAAIEARLWALLPEEFDGVELSPVAPLGACSAVATVDQHRVVSTARGTEVVSDSTNVLALEAATRRLAWTQTTGRAKHRQATADGVGDVHVAACHRQLRAQVFGPGFAAHFKLFTLVSSARDTGSGRTERRLLALHLGYWHRVLAELLPEQTPRALRYTDFGLAIGDLGVPVEAEPDRERGRGYYTSCAVRITAGDTELGDGGLTDWTAKLTGNAKERCLISSISTERLLAMR